MSEAPDYMQEFNKVYEDSKPEGGSGYTTYKIKNHQGKHNIVRLVGAPRTVKRAWVETDAAKKVPVVYDKNSVFQEIINKVLAFKWKEVKSKDGKQSWEKEYINKDKYGDVFFMVKQNGGTDSRDTGWEGQSFYPFNCIDRHDTWCVENKHTKLFCKTDYDIGISSQAFQSLKNDVIEDYGPFQDYDVDIKRIEDDSNQVKYVAKKADADLPEFGHLVKVGPLTEEEKAYEKYNLDELCVPSKASFLLKHLKNKISRIDQVCNTSFIHQLEEIASKEPKSANNDANVSTTTNESSSDEGFRPTGNPSPEGYTYEQLKSVGWNDSDIFSTYPMVVEKIEKKAAPAPAPKPAPKPVQPPAPKPVQPPAPKPVQPPAPKPVEEVRVDGFSYDDMKMAGWTDEQLLQDAKFKVLVEKKSSVNKTPSPTDPTIPCTQCGKPFSVHQETCPHCGFKDAAV